MVCYCPPSRRLQCSVVYSLVMRSCDRFLPISGQTYTRKPGCYSKYHTKNKNQNFTQHSCGSGLVRMIVVRIRRQFGFFPRNVELTILFPYWNDNRGGGGGDV